MKLGPLACLLLIIGASVAQNQCPCVRTENTLTVKGSAKVYIPSTIATVRVGVESVQPTAREAHRLTASRSSQLVSFLRSLPQVTKLRTEIINLNPKYDENFTLTGYSAVNVVSFQVSPNLVGSILDAAIENGGTRIDGVTHSATEEAQKTAEQQALRLAIDDAMQTARIALARLNKTLKEVVEITIDEQYWIEHSYYPMALRVGGGGYTTPYIAGEQEISGSVSLTITY